jgi:hypothetical protein
MSRHTFLFSILVVSSFGQVAQTQPGKDRAQTGKATTAVGQPVPGTRRANPAGREDIFSFATKRVNPQDIDYGDWLERRRQAFLESSVANPYFWYSGLATLLILAGMFAYGVRFLDERRKLWHAAEMANDFWNDAQYARSLANAAIEKYNTHMEECNRVIESQLSGRASPAALEASDFQSQLERVRAERDNLDSENKRLKAELERSSGLMDSLSARVNNLEPKVEQNGAGVRGGSGADGERNLVSKINSLQQQLDAERQQNRRLRGA